jgi:uncharacterized protein
MTHWDGSCSRSSLRTSKHLMSATEANQLQRLSEDGSRDLEAIFAILDAAFIAHVGFHANQPVVIPMIYGRDGDALYLQGSAGGRLLNKLDTGVPACVSVTVIDGLVLARSAFRHSINYRSVVAFGTGRKIAEPERKRAALRTISEHMLAGRWSEVRTPSRDELNATTVIEFSIKVASAESRQGYPVDEEDDYRRPVWAGILPLQLQAAAPEADPRLAEGITVPPYVLRGRNV